MAEFGSTLPGADMADTRTSQSLAPLALDFALLLQAHIGELINEAVPALSSIHLNSPSEMEVRGRLCDALGEDLVAKYENYALGLIRTYGKARFQDGKDTARLSIRAGSAAGIQAAVNNGMLAIVRELQRPKVAIYDEQGNLRGSMPGPRTRP